VTITTSQIKPVQRLTKYNLLFSDVYRHFGAQPPQAVAGARTLTLALALTLALP